MDKGKIVSTLIRLKTLAQIGLNFKNTPYDEERYEEMLGMADLLLADLTTLTPAKIEVLHAGEDNYITPKVDVRCVLIKDDRVLLIKERADGMWALPGGWADIGFTPAQVAVKEVREETGLEVEIDNLLAVFDNTRHGHPPAPFHIYKIFFKCKITGGDISKKGHEALEVAFFHPDDLPPLSEERNTIAQIKALCERAMSPGQTPPLFD